MTENSINTAEVLLQSVSTSTSSAVNCSTTIPADNSIPQQSTEGTLVLSLSITPTYSTSILEIWFSGVVTKDANAGSVQVALFQDSTANALAAVSYNIAASQSDSAQLRHVMTSGTTSSTTFKIHIGSAANTVYLNSDNAGNRRMGGVSNTCLVINEYLS